MVAQEESLIGDVYAQIEQLWGPLSEQHRELLLANLRIRQYRKNEIIYKDLETPKQMYYLIQGKVKIYKDGIGGRNQIIRVIKSGQFFGYRAFFAEEDYKTAGTALEPTFIALIPTEIVVDLMKTNSNICFFYIKTLAAELGVSDEKIISLTQKHIRGRLAEALLFLKDCYGVEEDGSTLSIYLSREDLANLSSMTTSNAIRTLSSFSNEKLVAIDGRKIKLINEEELQKVSKLG
ncbi:MAG: Crp/Fnr family transcriptional regulator [Prevotella sp.]|nr:Crp/Fnr family transcriptional regulator [Prevotella sp.]MDY4038248.1 Crp/Fnr family transcriptional regulator [Prevotella sp.]